MSLDNALRFVAGEFSSTRTELQAQFPKSGDMLADALLSSGYCFERGGRMAVSDMGRRRLADVDKPQEQGDGSA